MPVASGAGKKPFRYADRSGPTATFGELVDELTGRPPRRMPELPAAPMPVHTTTAGKSGTCAPSLVAALHDRTRTDRPAILTNRTSDPIPCEPTVRRMQTIEGIYRIYLFRVAYDAVA
jgi:hypothetical protein